MKSITECRAADGRSVSTCPSSRKESYISDAELQHFLSQSLERERHVVHAITTHFLTGIRQIRFSLYSYLWRFSLRCRLIWRSCRARRLAPEQTEPSASRAS